MDVGGRATQESKPRSDHAPDQKGQRLCIRETEIAPTLFAQLKSGESGDCQGAINPGKIRTLPRKLYIKAKPLITVHASL